MSLIVIEGTDGSGKSSLIKEMKKKYPHFVFVSDPGETSIGKQIREILLNCDNKNISDISELLLYCASRRQLVEEVIIPSLSQGKTVVSDRYIYSTMVYQSAAKCSCFEELITLSCASIFPQRVIFLDLSPEEGLKRINRTKDRLEEKGLSFMEKNYKLYLDILSRYDNVSYIDASKSIEEVHKEVFYIIEKEKL